MQSITRQCLEALEFIHGLGLIHCDLKPENILVKSYSRCEVKVIDLGSSCFQTDHLCSYVQSRSYRAPEVILGLPYDQKIDMWSLGCILAELCSGNVSFNHLVLQNMSWGVQAFLWASIASCSSLWSCLIWCDCLEQVQKFSCFWVAAVYERIFYFVVWFPRNDVFEGLKLAMVSSWASPHVRGQKGSCVFYGPPIVNSFWRSYCSLFSPQYLAWNPVWPCICALCRGDCSEISCMCASLVIFVL